MCGKFTCDRIHTEQMSDSMHTSQCMQIVCIVAIYESNCQAGSTNQLEESENKDSMGVKITTATERMPGEQQQQQKAQEDSMTSMDYKLYSE